MHHMWQGIRSEMHLKKTREHTHTGETMDM
jgi:hypothetical protein